MAGVLDGVDQRTRLVGENRLELLLFTLGGHQRFGINVFKVQEVIQCPPLTRMASANPIVRGITNMRGRTISILDLGMAIGKRPIENIDNAFVIVSEYNRTVQGFLVTAVDRIINMKWEEIKTPPRGLGSQNYMTAVTEVDGELVELIDVEKILAELVGVRTDISDTTQLEGSNERPLRLLVVDDSSVARNQIKRTLEQLGMECILAKNGREGVDTLLGMSKDNENIYDQIDAVISDVEMPEMDGYTLTSEIRKNEKLKALPILLHTSLSGTFNKNMVSQVGADMFVPKFNAEELAESVRSLLKNKGITQS
ncbi:MAG TPA: chemotaxis signal transduction protein CheV [Gammaproteobacteria bacterium]|nr:chemotaxis signal transduction protein CheV [Gammaproteobacteria bacterium]